MELFIPFILFFGYSITGNTAEKISNNDYTFDIELFQEVSNNNANNVIIGSSNIDAALMVLTEASTGQTRQQIISTLGLPPNIENVRKLASNILASFKVDNTTLQSAVKLWAKNGLQILNEFRQNLKTSYHGSIENINFLNNNKAAHMINSWVANETNDEITSLISSGDIDASTRVIIVDTTYFKGTWKTAFKKHSTRTSCFFVHNAVCTKVPLMYSSCHYKYTLSSSLNAQIIEVPYKAERFSMIFILPQKRGNDALVELIGKMKTTKLSSVLSNMNRRKVELYIPRFTIKNKLNLNSYLKKLGIQDLFDSKANLSNAFPNSQLQVDSIVHSAVIRVDEEGTVAAAATGVTIRMTAIFEGYPTVFRADRPFLLFLVDLKENQILFSGKYVNPDA